MALIRSIATVGGYTMASRILGFARDILIAGTLGAGPIADAFFVAFKLPNFFRRLFAEGAFNAAFVPLFTARLTDDGPAAARRFAEEVLSVLVVTLLFLVTVLQIFMPWAMSEVFARGFADNPEQMGHAVEFARICFPYLLFISLVSQLGGILNSLGKFAAAAATPILLNLCLIGALFVLAPITPTPGHALSWGVMLAGILQFLWLVDACRREGMVFRLPRPRLNDRVKRLLVLIGPGAVGAGVVQINMLIGTLIATYLPTGSVSYLYYSDRVYQLPLGVIGIAGGTALLPLLARQIRSGEAVAAMYSFNRALEFSLVLTIPAAVALVVIPAPIIQTLFERGAFGAAETLATAQALMAYSLGLPAYVMIKVLTPGFFARHDTRTPVIVAAGAVVINLVLSLVLMGPFLHTGLALATAAAAWINAVALAWILVRRGHLRFDRRLLTKTPRIVGSAAGMAAALAAGNFLLTPAFGQGQSAAVGALVALVVLGLAVYGVLAAVTGAMTVGELKSMSRRRARKT